MFPPVLCQKTSGILENKFHRKIIINHITSVGGGCINHAVKLNTSCGNYFLKWNDAGLYPGMFEAEAKGLRILNNAGEIYIPSVIEYGETTGFTFLLLKFVEPAARKKDFWEHFGRALAKLHKHTHPCFGLDHDNYIGSLKQNNKQCTGWIDFFVHQRLEPQIRMAKDSGTMSNMTIRHFEIFFSHLYTLVPAEPPALLHGDLWNGNFIIKNNGYACLIDPAVYYGHRETDLAMTKLFGGFDEKFYGAYQEEFPLEKGFEKRTDIHNLYPLMVHANLFGGGYMRNIENILSSLL